MMANPKESPPIENLDVPGAATWLGVSERTVSDLVASDTLPHFRVGKQIRFNLEELRRWAKEGATKNG